MQRKGQFLYNTIAKEIIDNKKLQHDWLIPNEESLVDEYVEGRLLEMTDSEFDLIMTEFKKQVME
ncbi:MAG: hypothetical protein ACRD9Q_08070 [Nitrososphaeraceae archaeon]